jgi:hypothetical protein
MILNHFLHGLVEPPVRPFRMIGHLPHCSQFCTKVRNNFTKARQVYLKFRKVAVKYRYVGSDAAFDELTPTEFDSMYSDLLGKIRPIAVRRAKKSDINYVTLYDTLHKYEYD